MIISAFLENSFIFLKITNSFKKGCESFIIYEDSELAYAKIVNKSKSKHVLELRHYQLLNATGKVQHKMLEAKQHSQKCP